MAGSVRGTVALSTLFMGGYGGGGARGAVARRATAPPSLPTN